MASDTAAVLDEAYQRLHKTGPSSAARREPGSPRGGRPPCCAHPPPDLIVRLAMQVVREITPGTPACSKLAGGIKEMPMLFRRWRRS